ncbi:MAG: adenylate/guanylate cyclase domain-containing protein [Actinomycetota bacterium]|nr:adenylate/guanylate cyclase domain-containing protein [Actinomycetota bacterium]
MVRILDVVIGRGVTDAQSHAEQRRVRTINVVAFGAFSCTSLLTVVFALLGARVLGETPFWLFLSSSLIFMCGYAAVLVINGLGRHDGAVVLALTTGLANLVLASAFVGFGVGTSVFLAVPAIAVLLITRAEDSTVRWAFVIASVAAFALLAAVDTQVADAIAGTWVEVLLVVANFAAMVGFAVAVVWNQRLLADRTEQALETANELSERLLLNILPKHIADRLRAGESPIADRIDHVTVLFADIVDSTPLSERLSARDWVALLDSLFTRFDELAEGFGLEKIKTIGDGYMVVGGLDAESQQHEAAIAEMALAMRSELEDRQAQGLERLRMRFGIASGPVVAGVIGSRKLSYDLWGDTVNTASRMESHGQPDQIQVTQTTYRNLRNSYMFSDPREVQIKGKGLVTTYFLIGPKPSESVTPSK